MSRQNLGLTLTGILSAFVMFLAGGVPEAQPAVKLGVVNSHTIKSAVYTKVTPIKTMALRDMRNLNQPPVMRAVMGNRTYTQQQTEMLRQKLLSKGYIKQASGPFTIPLMTLKPAGEQMPRFINPHTQHAIGQHQDFSTSFAFPGIGASDSPPDSIGCAPPDTDNAVGYDSTVGSDVVVEIVNLCTQTGVGSFKVWNASDGSVILNTTGLGSLWSTSDCINGGGDNQVNYDQFAHRWFLSQFNSTYTGICVAISTSDDPTGSYYLYDIVMDPNGFTDYPKMGKWITGDDNTDAYYISANDFPPAACGNCVVYTAVQRSAMLTGSPAGVLTIIGPNYSSGLDFSALPADVDGLTTPPLDAPEYFVDYISPYYYGGSTYALEMWQMSVDWGANSASLTGPTQINVNAFTDGDFGCAPQPSPGECLPVLGDRLMYRLAYRNGTTATSDQILLVDHAVVDTSQSTNPIGIDWYQLDAPSGDTNAADWAINQQGLFSPADGNSRFMGSISMDHVGNIALGYTISSPTIDPSAAVTGQNSGTGGGVMDATETIFLAGSGVQESTGRWGDYSAIMASATDDCTFWTAQEYISNTGSFNWSTANGALKFNGCSIGPEGTLTGTVTDASSNNPIAGAHVTLTPGNISGTTNGSGVYSMTVPVNSYTATASKFGYLPSSASVVITQNTTSTQDFALTVAPSATVSGNLVDATPGGHAYGLYGEIKVTTPSAGQVADIWTNPQTGAYSVQLPEGNDYTFNATAYLPGYNTGSVTITNLSGDANQNIGLTVGAGCAAPGYAFVSGFGQDFDEGFPPSGWTVTNDYSGSPIQWDTNANWSDGNYTLPYGSGVAATADSNNAAIIYGYFGSYDTSLVTPEIQVSSLPANGILQFGLNYQEYSGNDAMDVDISGDGGSTWTNLAHITSNQGTLYNTPGVNYMVPVTIPNGATQVLIRWRYYNLVSGFDWYAQVDNVSIGACSAIAGGLVEGQVTDANTGSGLNGATVFDSNTPSNSAKTATNASDPNLPAAYYFLFSNTNGSDVITGSDSGYNNVAATLNVTDDSVTLQNFPLTAPLFNGTPGSFNIHVQVGTMVPKTFTIDNTGTGPGTFSFLTFDFPPPSGPGQGLGAPLNLIQCTNLRPQSLVASKGKGGFDPGCGIGDDKPGRSPQGNAAWVSITNYPSPIMDDSSAEDESTGLVYDVGGYNGSAVVATGNVYDPGTSAWSAIAPMPAALEKPASAFINGKLYVADGWTSSGNPSSALYIYDPSSNTWSTGANNPAPEGGGAGVAAYNGKMYLVGGCPTGSSCGDTPVEAYDPSSGTWTAAGALAPYPHQNSWESCGAVQGTLYCAGGTAGSTEYADGYAYNATGNSWSSIASIPVSSGGLWGSGYIGTGSGLLVSGGVTANFTTVTNEGFVYTPGSNTWTQLPNSINTVYRGGSACGFYKIGGSIGGFSPVDNAEMLPGYTPCGTSPIPWLTITPMTGPAPIGQTPVTFTFDGTGQTEFTTSQAYVLLEGTPYAPQQVDLTVTWDPLPVDLVVTASANLNTVFIGSVIAYNVKITNKQESGHGQASQTTLTYVLPAGVTDVVSDGPGTCSLASGTVTCGFGTLAQGASVSETLIVTPATPGPLASTFKATALEPDTAGNNTATVNGTVLGIADASVSSYSVSPSSVQVGHTTTYHISVTNTGPDQATGVVMTAPLPASLTFKSASAGCSNSGGLVTCTVGNLAINGQANATIVVTANTVGTINTMTAVGATSADPKVSNNSATTSLTVTSSTGGGGGGGGGGGADMWMLAVLASLFALRRTRRGRSTPQ